jgi:proline dehydrogenase
MTDADFEKLDLFYGRVHQIAKLAQERNCSLYVDAE